MQYAYSLGGVNTPLIMKFQVNATLATANIPVLAPGAGNAGVQISTTTSLANVVGVTLDTATYVTAQQTDGTSAEREVSVIISPDAVWRAKMSGGATENTALTQHTVSTASTDGLAITTGTAWDSATYDEGVTWGYTGANAGAKRKITSVSSTAGTVTVAFDQDTAVGDIFLRAPYWPLDNGSKTVQLSTLLTQADASIAVGTGGACRVIDLELRDASDSGTTNSFVLFIFDDHALRETT